MRGEDLSFFEEEEFKEALEAYENMIQGSGSAYLDADELTDIAEYYMVNNRRKDAQDCIDYALELHPGSVDPQVFLSRQAMFDGNLPEAWAICKKIEDQDDREVQLLTAELWMREQKPKIAFNFLVDIYSSLKHGKVDFLKDSIDIFLDYAVFDLPLTLIESLLELTPFDAEGWTMMAEAQSGLNHFEESLEACDYALAISEKGYRPKLIKANALFQLDKPEEAHNLYQEYIKECPQEETARFLDAVCLMSLTRYEEALEILEVLSESQEPTISRQTIPYRCVCYLNLGEWEKYLHYLPIAVEQERDLTVYLLESYYPGVLPEQYFEYTCTKMGNDKNNEETPF